MTKCKIIINYNNSLNKPLFYYMTDEYKNYIGANTGNLLINEYGLKHIDYDFNTQFEDAEEVLFLAANDLRPNSSFDFKKWNQILSKTNKKFNIMGLGANAILENMEPKEYIKTLNDDIIEWCHKISERCVSIGVRGEFTADVLKELGITNVDIIGCPTWFVNGYDQPDIIKRTWSNSLKPVFHTAWDPYTDWHIAWHNNILNQILAFEDPKFVMQSEFGFLPYMIANKDIPQFIAAGLTQHDLIESVKSIAKHFGISEFDVWQNSKIRNMFEMFANIDNWAEFIKTRDFSFGFRIHGSIMAIKNGIPAICLCSDSRTYELCKIFHIPFVKVNEIASGDLNIHKIYDEADFTKLNTEYPKLLQNYIQFLNKNNIKHKLSIKQTCSC